MVKYLQWDSIFFGIKVGRLKSAHGNGFRFLEKQLREAQKQGYQCLYLETPISAMDWLPKLSTRGFILVDLKTTLRKTKLRTYRISHSLQDDRQERHRPFLETIACQISSMSRFAVDKNFSAKSKDLYKVWTMRSFFEAYCDQLYYYLKNNRPAGFVTLRIKNGVPFIDLLAVDRPYRRLGVAAELLKASETWAVRQGFNELRVVTQGGNLPALQFYQKNGFVTCDVTLFYHKWL